MKTFFETAGNHIVKYFCKSEEDLISYIQEQKILVADKRNDDNRNKLRCTRNAKHAENLKKTTATSTKSLLSVSSIRSTSEESSNVAPKSAEMTCFQDEAEEVVMRTNKRKIFLPDRNVSKTCRFN